MYHTLFIYSPVGGHLGCFHFGVITDKAARTFVNKSLCRHMLLFPFGKELGVERFSHMVGVCETWVLKAIWAQEAKSWAYVKHGGGTETTI